MALLKLARVEIRYGKLAVLRNVSMEVLEGEMVAIIGSNGSGKTTLLRGISGFVHPSTGAIVFQDEDVSSLATHQLVKRGISMVPDGRQLFGSLPVLENLELGTFSRYMQLSKNDLRLELEHVYSFFPILRERRKQLAGTLSGGEQQMLTIGRALMSKPRLLLLDEPSFGLAPQIVKEVLKILRRLTEEEHLTIILAEQDVRIALSIANRACLLQIGEIILEGPANTLAARDDIQAIYLGTPTSYRCK